MATKRKLIERFPRHPVLGITIARQVRPPSDAPLSVPADFRRSPHPSFAHRRLRGRVAEIGVRWLAAASSPPKRALVPLHPGIARNRLSRLPQDRRSRAGPTCSTSLYRPTLNCVSRSSRAPSKGALGGNGTDPLLFAVSQAGGAFDPYSQMMSYKCCLYLLNIDTHNVSYAKS